MTESAVFWRERQRQVRRIVLGALFGVVIAAPAGAEPLLVATFSGVIPTLTVTTQVRVTNSDGTSTETAPVESTLSNVPFSGGVTFDASVWALTSLVGPPPQFPLREFNEVDPSGPSGTGVETAERIAGRLNVGNGIGALSFDRHLVDTTAAVGDVLLPYQGSTRMGYVDGLDGLALDPPGELGDSFYFSYSNSYGRFEPGALPLVPGPPGEVFFRTEISRLSLDIHTGFDTTFTLHDLFGAGPPLAFSWVDPNPGLCSLDSPSCDDGFRSFGSEFFHRSIVNAWGADSATSRSVSYAGSLVLTRVDLAPKAVPEPGSMSLIALGLGAIGAIRRRRRCHGRAKSG